MRNAQAVVGFLKARSEVARVIHPSVQVGPARARADRYLTGGCGALVGIELAAGREAGRRFIDGLKLFYHVANIGDAPSLAIHPATTTHAQLTVADPLASGVSEGYVRLSIGIEHIDDLLADLDQALAAAGRLAQAACGRSEMSRPVARADRPNIPDADIAARSRPILMASDRAGRKEVRPHVP